MSVRRYNCEGYFDPTAYEAFINIEKETRAASLESLSRRVPNYRPLVYICSPYAGDIGWNVQNALRYCRFAMKQKCLPLAPHLYFTRFLDDANEEQRAEGLFMGYILMTKCAEVWVFGDYISRGMAAEINSAERRGMRIRYFTMDCEEVGP
jgi:hypothetical protein